MLDVISMAPADVRLWVSLDVHKLSIVAAALPPTGGQPEVQQIETRGSRSVGSSTGSVVRRGWRSATRQGRAGLICCAC
jgi:hypothetical protein